jgi:MoCo/4Fe-4S cofactor protein with predicted Tat translocation signal
MSNTKKYWRSVEHLNDESAELAAAQNEFAEKLPVDEFLGKTDLADTSTSRRDFLKFLGFSVTAATLAACEAPVTKAIPYVVKPEEITPGVANWYASTYSDGNDYCSVLVKTREGRPIHIEGNKLSKVTTGGVSARVNASVMSLYDGTRIKQPLIGGAVSTWNAVDADIEKKLTGIASRGGSIRLLTSSINSPSTKQAIADFSEKFGGAIPSIELEGDVPAQTGNVKHVTYDVLSQSGMIKANQKSFGASIIPSYNFAKANVIVSVAADFLANWISPIEFAAQYGKGRLPENGLSKHYQFETDMSLTGSNADVRGAIKPSEQGAVVAALYNAVASKVGKGSVNANVIEDDNKVIEKINSAAVELVANKGKSLVVSGSNDTDVQVLVNGINEMLGNYEGTIDLSKASNVKQGDDAEVYALVNEMKAGAVDALIVWGVNPLYSLPSSWNFAEAISKVKLSVSMATRVDETSEACEYVCPDSHYLESWNDFNPKAGEYSLAQPTISNLFDTRQGQSSLLKWCGSNTDFNAYVKKYWEANLFSKQSESILFSSFWNKVLQEGVFSTAEVAEVSSTFVADAASSANTVAKTTGSGIELIMYSKVGIGDGKQLRNPWLQELSDPISKIVWDNYITMNPRDMDEYGFNKSIQQVKPADVATIKVGNTTVTLPVISSPGQKIGTIGIAVGYGQKGIEVEGALVGQNVLPLTTINNGTISYSASNVEIIGTGETYPIASTQTHHTMMGRKIVNETSLDLFKNEDRKVWNPVIELPNAYGEVMEAADLDLWNEHDIKKGHRWGMSIDLSSCIGCGACITACNSENNVPVVGKDETRRNREMTWLRIDRYFSSDQDPAPFTFDKGGMDDYKKMEIPSDYPQVVHQPVMCQHCNHAPCETVCPVAATTHSDEGFNQMTYNRCVGTRYCANNCPYKVRRFNWFNYYRDFKFEEVNPSQDDLGRMVLNPDVVVRSRGVMEKCSLCVQRIQEGKLSAKKDGTAVIDQAIQTACSASCPTNAIIFGDHNDKESKLAVATGIERAYHMIEEVGTQPNVWYQTKVRNAEALVKSAPAGEDHHNEDKKHA